MNKYSNYYIVTHNSNVFDDNTVVTSITSSGECCLISDLNDSLKREWIMYTSLYPIDSRKLKTMRFPYNYEKYDKIAEEFINNN